MDILGINAFHGDASAVLLRSGSFLCGIEEERLNRVKHWAGFPSAAISSVLEAGRTALPDVPHVAVSRNPGAHLVDKVLFTLRHRPGLEAIRSRLGQQRSVQGIEQRLGAALGNGAYRGRVHKVEHHRAHLASAFFCSPFEQAACLTVDGFGDFLSSMAAVGRGSHLEVIDDVMFPNSLGIFYTAVTQYLGFPKYGDEYKVMGLAAYGRPTFLPQMRGLVATRDDGQFENALDFFRHASEGVTMSWDEGEPVLGPLWTDRFTELLGPARRAHEPIEERHHDIASSLQARYEEVFFHRLRWLHKRTGLDAICLAGGCAMNSVANGKIFRETDFKDVFIQSAAGDAGTALGAAAWVWHHEFGKPRAYVMEHSYHGPEFPPEQLDAALRGRLPGFEGRAARLADGLVVERSEAEAPLLAATAEAIARGEVVGWYQGKTEWGPRALGNRSILADPRRAEMKDVLNARIKRREPFRPFAPSILEERVGDYFEESYPDPFMVKVYPIRPSKRPEIPAVCHVDGTGRLQTVSRPQNPRYWALIKAFEQATGVPVLLNTSFNENEPIVNTPEEAIDCFLRTRMDRLVLGDWVVARGPAR